MKKVIASLLPGFILTSTFLASLVVFSSGCLWRGGGRGHGHGHGYGHGHHRGRRGW
jgi:hypothetical protein